MTKFARVQSYFFRITLVFTLLVSVTSASSTPAPRTIAHQKFAFQGTKYAYVVFTPSGFVAGKQLPALLLLHGAHGRGEDMLRLWQAFADENGIILIAPTLPLDAESEKQAPQMLTQLMEEVRLDWHFDPHRAYIFGYSAGGYFTYDAAALASNYFAAAGVFAMIIDPSYSSIVKGTQRKTPIALYIGDRDPNFSLRQTRATRDLLVANGFNVHYIELKNQDHNYAAVSAQVNRDAWKFMSQYVLP